jgi:hypothetical protein
MMKFGTRILASALMTVLLTAVGAVAGERPVVVELFTSQGCSSCPPAEAFMRDLAKRDDLIALEFHVDYWDYIGWKDRFAKREFTERQEGYVGSLKGRYKYTPQMVVGGVSHAVGSNRAAIEAEIERRKSASVEGPEIEVHKEDGAIVAKIGAGAASGVYDIVFVTFDKPHSTEVKRGENRGRTLVNAQVVRDYEMLGSWSGTPVDLRIPIAGRPGDGGCAILVQKRGYGEIVAAVSLPFDS